MVKTPNKKKFLPFLIISETYINWRNDRTLRLGAGIAYYGVFAIIPLFTLMFGVAAYFFSTQDIKSFLGDTLTRIMGNELSVSVNLIIEKFINNQLQGVMTGASIVGVIALLISASFIFVAFQDALDVIWGNSIRLGFKKWIKRYLWAYLVVLLASSLLFVAIFINSIGTFLVSVFPGRFEIIESFENITVTAATWGFSILIIAMIYKLLIMQKISWRILVFGSAFTALLVYVGTWLLGIYISNYAGNSVGGALGAVLLLLIWVYYEAQIALVGAQLIKTLNQNLNKLPKIFQKS